VRELAQPDDAPAGGVGGEWQRLLLVERSMLLAPLCEGCGHFHLRAGRYALAGATVQALGLAGAEPHAFRRLAGASRGGCAAGPEDWRVRLDLDGEGA